MKKVFLDYSDWKAILFCETGLHLMEQELLDYISKLASRKDVTVVLNENEKPVWILKYDVEKEKFNTFPIG
ncbi:MAG: hypothetical protein ACOYO1_06605 [Bacteroidales bacterium]